MRPMMLLATLTILLVVAAPGQTYRTAADTVATKNVTFGSQPTDHAQEFRTSFIGVDIMLSNGGVGLGTFFRHEYNDVTSMFVDFSISEAKDDDERDFYDYLGNRYTIGKVNRFLVLPLFVGMQQRMFKDDIVDNFRPYVCAAAGPTMIYEFPNNDDFFSALGKGMPKYSFGGYLGLGAYFGAEHGNILGVNIRYYYLPYPAGLENLAGVLKTQFGGFYITINFGSPI